MKDKHGKSVVLLGSTPPPIGGIAKWTMRMMSSQLKDNWNIILVDEKIVGARQPFGDKIKYNYRDEYKRWTSFWKLLNSVIRNADSKLAHACPIATTTSLLANIVSGMIVKFAKKKYIIHFRCTVPNLVHSKLQLYLLKIICALSDQVIVLNNQSKLFLGKYSNTPCICIPNFVDQCELSTNRQYRETISKAVYVGGVIKEKGCVELIKAAQLLPDIEFRLVGVASSEIKHLSECCPNIVLVGVKDSEGVSEELRGADMFLFIGKYPGEGFSNSLAEAMAAGLPCIVTDWAANADMIDDGKGGIVIKENDPVSIKLAVEKLSSKSVREQMSKYNMDKVKNHYTSEVILSKYVDVYNQVCKIM